MKIVVKSLAYKSTEAGLYGFQTLDDKGIHHSIMLFEQTDNIMNLAKVKPGDSLEIEEVIEPYRIYRILIHNGIIVYVDWFREGF